MVIFRHRRRRVGGGCGGAYLVQQEGVLGPGQLPQGTAQGAVGGVLLLWVRCQHQNLGIDEPGGGENGRAVVVGLLAVVVVHVVRGGRSL